MTILKALSVTLILLATVGAATAADKPTPLDLSGTSVKKLEVSQSQIGYTSTRVFYTLGDHLTVVMVHVDNTKKEFPVTGKVYRFGKDVTTDGIAKWLNNQHSDGLFPEVPEPVATDKLPADAFKTIESKSLGQTKAPNGAYDKYSVTFKINEVKVNDQFGLKEFKETVTVYVEAK